MENVITFQQPVYSLKFNEFNPLFKLDMEAFFKWESNLKNSKEQVEDKLEYLNSILDVYSMFYNNDSDEKSFNDIFWNMKFNSLLSVAFTVFLEMPNKLMKWETIGLYFGYIIENNFELDIEISNFTNNRFNLYNDRIGFAINERSANNQLLKQVMFNNNLVGYYNGSTWDTTYYNHNDSTFKLKIKNSNGTYSFYYNNNLLKTISGISFTNKELTFIIGGYESSTKNIKLSLDNLTLYNSSSVKKLYE